MERRLLKEIPLDQRAVFEKKRQGTRRDALSEVGRHMDKPHAIALAGVRRCGKPTLLRQIAEQFLRGRALSELVQVALSLADPQVRAREVAAMTEALDEQKLDVGLVLTESDREDIVVGKRTIQVRPLAGWLCHLDG